MDECGSPLPVACCLIDWALMRSGNACLASEDLTRTTLPGEVATSSSPGYSWKVQGCHLTMVVDVSAVLVTTCGHRYSATTLLLPIQAQGILGEAV